LKTYVLRYERQCANAAAVATFLEKHPAVAGVRYPGLPSHPQHARDLNPAEREWAAVTDRTMRLSVGIEAVEDLIADLEQALSSAPE
jgi:cystathionine beta-lyase/cystathionine gamma-synthase